MQPFFLPRSDKGWGWLAAGGLDIRVVPGNHLGMLQEPHAAPADSLLHVCGHASYSKSRQSLRWLTDAWLIVNRHPDLDWDLLLDCARRSHLALPLSVALSYLANDLNAPIPLRFLNRLSRSPKTLTH